MSRQATTVESWTTATAVLRLATELVEGIQTGLVKRGFTDVRPVHGFAFARLAEAPTTTTQLAEHLGITKQATAEVVGYLEQTGYVTRTPDPHDRRARLLVLTEHGLACTRAAQRAAAETIQNWNNQLTERQQTDLHDTLAKISNPGRLRPAW